MSKINRKLPYFAGFLKYAMENPVIQRRDTIIGSTVAGIFFTSPFVGLTFGLAMKNVGIGLFAGALAAAIGVGAGIFAYRRSQSKMTEQDKVKAGLSAMSAEWQRMRGSGKLTKNADGKVLTLLESAAYNWTRIQNVCKSPTFNQPTLAVHWVSLRDQARMSADLAMMDLLHLCEPALGEPTRNREDDVKGVFQSIAELDIAEALDGLKTVAKADWTEYAHKSPHARLIIEQGFPLVERLKSLADEIEHANQRAVMEVLPDMEGNATTQSLDAILQELKAVREAEDEILQQRVGQGDN